MQLLVTEVLTKPIMAFLDVILGTLLSHAAITITLQGVVIVSVELEMFYLDMHDCDYWYLQAER